MREELYRYLPMLSRCEFFRGIEAGRLSGMLEDMDARLMEYDRGETIYRVGDIVRLVSIVLEGAVMIGDEDADGGSVNITLLEPGDELGAYMVISGRRRSSLRVYAAARCRMVQFDLAGLLSAGRRDDDQWRLMSNMLTAFAGRSLELYQKASIYGKKRIRSRIRLYLMSLETVDGAVVLPMNRTELAAWLGVDRAALAREMGRMQDEGLISVDRRRVKLLNRDFFLLHTADGDNC